MPPYTTNLEHLRDELRRLNLLLEQAIKQFRASHQQNIPAEFSGLYISDAEIDNFLQQANQTENQASTEAKTQLITLHSQIQQRIQQTLSAGISLRLPYLCQIFNLSPFETDILLLALAPELNLRYQKLYAYLQDDVTRKRPSVDLALRLFCLTIDERIQAREIFAPQEPLLDVPLILLHEDPTERPTPLLNRSLKLDDRITAFLLGSDTLDSRLCHPTPMVRRVLPKRHLHSLILPEVVKATLQQIISLEIKHSSWLCILHGAAGAGKKSCAEAVAQARNQTLLVLDLPKMLKAELPFSTLINIAFREARLYQGIVYLDGWEELLTEELKYKHAIQLIEQQIEQFQGLVFLATHVLWQPNHAQHYQFIQIKLPLPDESSRLLLWQTSLNQSHTIHPQVNLSYLASAFRFSGGQIQRAIKHAENYAHLQESKNCTVTDEILLKGCRLESNQHLVTFARKITPKRIWQDLVLPKDTLTQLQELCKQVRYRSKVYTDWGFDGKLSLGKGLIALFTGDSGTGKTLSAEILAKDLELELYQVDISLVVSKYIGETEKNLSRVFDEAQTSNAILFFDEADALFGKRSDVKDAHDRYANIEVNYLLQRVEEYQGIIILSSNLSKNIDKAFVRRLHFSIEFPFPDEQHRLQIWRGIFPKQAPISQEVDFEFLARKFKIAGGNIKNVALAAAFQAATDGDAIKMKHLMLAMKREYQKLGKVCERTDFVQYYELVR
ncbi:ATP-binding protein [Calothrix sp. FACHB-1219]|uniref:AAA family ATPase n=1 Tax=unclassified Calothrix TaxID=2619626 RepID=UPI0016823B25|nr:MULTISPECIES: AAA family ATPase [unclassified Calothrix]MBD2207034.1 ATP-binding protein [Calothrix sp. FACHB-168]MBD2221650.1 ATP-binding protein [Calothrix sp. FACHB-1219]